MELWQAIILGIVQGITEFLPISSSAHLILMPVLTGWDDQGVGFDLSVHVGTLLAVILYFRKDVAHCLRRVRSIRSPKCWSANWVGWSLLPPSLPAFSAYCCLTILTRYYERCG